MFDSNKKIVYQDTLDEYHKRISALIGRSTKVEAGFTPVGTVISVMGKTAPANYLACDGSIINIADYPILADYFMAQFDSKNYFGGNGTTTFAVPDLRGEFLRGTGTNGHANQGNGADVGVHQDATASPQFSIGTAISTYGTPVVNNADSNIGASVTSKIITLASSGSNKREPQYTSRPTNTSVLYCIATHDIYIDARFDYSTTEKMVGTWIDGKPLWQKTVGYSIVLTDGEHKVAHNVANIDAILSVQCIAKQDNTYIPIPNAWVDGGGSLWVSANLSNINFHIETDWSSVIRNMSPFNTPKQQTKKYV